jgi:hypothetical protein
LSLPATPATQARHVQHLLRKSEESLFGFINDGNGLAGTSR